MRRRLGIAALVALGACGSGAKPSGGAGNAAAAGLVAAVEHAAATRAPWRCATRSPSTTTGELVAGERTWRRAGETLTSADRALTIVAVADARGDASATWRERLRAAEPAVVLTLGGLGTTEAEIAASLGALVDPAWLTVAIPGDAEGWPAHRAAVATVAATGAPVVDGADVRLLDGGAAVIATLPGPAHAARLAAGADGCEHDDADAAAIIAALVAAAGARPTVLAATRAPQGGGARGVAGVPAGDPGLTAAVAGLTAVVHAPLMPGPTGPGRAGRAVAVIAAGSLDPVPRFAVDGARAARSLTAVTIDDRALTWRPIVVDTPPR